MTHPSNITKQTVYRHHKDERMGRIKWKSHAEKNIGNRLECVGGAYIYTLNRNQSVKVRK